jgi:hypothetical protein
MKTVLLLIGFILGSIHFAEAQQLGKIARISYVSGSGNASNQGRSVAVGGAPKVTRSRASGSGIILLSIALQA